MKSGLGRPSSAEKYNDAVEYLNKHLLPIKDAFDQCKIDERKALKEYKATQGRTRLLRLKFEYATDGLEKWRIKKQSKFHTNK